MICFAVKAFAKTCFIVLYQLSYPPAAFDLFPLPESKIHHSTQKIISKKMRTYDKINIDKKKPFPDSSDGKR
ncbi:hypothetical protein D3Z56_06810 [Lachnospiraceae bacterium]|nr:hypothetical protein [Lachnospiraceae bacterium]